MKRLSIACTVCVVACSAAMAAAGRQHHPAPRHHTASLIVAYDAKDRKYYSVMWARAHHMHDNGGDLLAIRSLSSLPRGAKLSHAMHGKL